MQTNTMRILGVLSLSVIATTGCATTTAADVGSDEAPIISGSGVGQAEYDAAYPWMLAMSVGAPYYDADADESNVHCGAELIAPDLVLTAGHCVADGAKLVSPAVVRFARGTVLTTKMKNTLDETSTFGAKAIHRHPSFVNSPVADFDVALVRLKTPQPGPFAKLATAPAPAGTSARIIGWGDTLRHGPDPDDAEYEDSFFPKQLRRAEIELISTASCRQSYSGKEKVTDRMICASEKTGTCHGDSGGPLLVGTPDDLRIAGLTSWGLGCGTKKYASVFARIEGELGAWIDRCSKDETACAKP